MIIYQYEKDDGLESVLKANNSIAFHIPFKLIDDKYPLEKCNNFRGISKSIANINANPNQFDLFYFESILASTGWNENDDVFTPFELMKARKTPVDKPVNRMHDNNDIIGHMTSSYVLVNGKVVDESIFTEFLPIKFDVGVSAVIYKYWVDEAKNKAISELIEEIKNNEWYVSMECLFPNFDYAVIKPNNEQEIIVRTDATSFLSKYLRIYGGTGTYQNHKIGRVLKDFTFSGKGIVNNPANKRSFITTISDNGVDTNTVIDMSTVANIERPKQDNNKKEIIMPSELKFTQEDIDLVKAKVDIATANLTQKETELVAKVNELTIANNTIEALKVAIEENKNSNAKLQEDLNAKDATIANLTTELNNIKKLAIASERLTKLMKKGVSEDRAKSLVDSFSSVSEDIFDIMVDNITVTQSECSPDKKMDDKEKEKDKASDATQKLDGLNTDEPSLATSASNNTDSELLISKASEWITKNLQQKNK